MERNKNITIDKSTGEIKLQTPLDFEGLSQKLREAITFRVTAQDKGTPPLSSSKNITLIVTDENDLAPVFTKSKVDYEIFENATKGEK